jgi:acetyl esterase/lipase
VPEEAFVMRRDQAMRLRVCTALVLGTFTGLEGSAFCLPDDKPGMGKPAAATHGELARNIEVQIVRNLSYRELYPGEDARDDRDKLDLYLPKGLKDYPVLFFVHGGAWIRGNKDHFGMYSALGLYWARHGVGMVVPNYRLSPGVQHPEHIKDVARAFAWTQKNIARYGGSPEQIFVAGHSAGGHLVALLATDESYLKAERLSLHNIRGVIPISGVYRIHDIHIDAGINADPRLKGFSPERLEARSRSLVQSVFGSDPKVLLQASPLTHVRPGLPPFLVIYAEHDLPTLGDMAREFDQALEKKNDDVKILEIKDRNHLSVLLRACREDDPVPRAMADFIQGHVR